MSYPSLMRSSASADQIAVSFSESRIPSAAFVCSGSDVGTPSDTMRKKRAPGNTWQFQCPLDFALTLSLKYTPAFPLSTSCPPPTKNPCLMMATLHLEQLAIIGSVIRFWRVLPLPGVEEQDCRWRGQVATDCHLGVGMIGRWPNWQPKS